MDRLIYISMTAAKNIFLRQAGVAHNLSNVGTNGFRAELHAHRAAPVIGPGSPTRAFAVDTTVATDFTPGMVRHTGNPLDVALNGRGWIAVQGTDGNEAYTRDGAFRMSPNGILQVRGLNVLGDAGPVTIPPENDILIAKDGTVSATPLTGNLNATLVVGRIKLTNPPDADLVRGDDGLFRTRDGQPAAADGAVTLMAGSIEAGNVNATEAVMDMISLARQFDLQLKMLGIAKDNAQTADKMLTPT